MKRALALIPFLLLFGAGWVFGQQSGNGKTGSDWKPISEIGRTWYVVGFIDGYLQGILDGYALTRVPAEPGETDPLNGLKQPSPLFVKDARARATASNSKSATYAQIINTMSDIYGDFRNTPICWPDAFFLAKESLAGHPPSDQDLARIRAGSAQAGCLP